MIAEQRARNLLLLLLALAVLALAVLGCGAEREEGAATIDSSATTTGTPSQTVADDVDTAFRSRVDAMVRSAPPGLDACNVARHVTAALDTIRRWPRPLLSHHDDCVLTMLDSLRDGFVRTGSPAYLEALDSIASYSDGYVSEAVWVLADSAFRGRPDAFLSHLVRDGAGSAPIEQALVGEWRTAFHEQKDSATIKRDLLGAIRSKARAAELTPEHGAYLDTLLVRARLLP